MGNGLKTACFFLSLCFLPLGLFPQEPERAAETAETIPEALRMPGWGEAARYPQDLVIGELGRGEAPEGAYRFAEDILRALLAGSSGAPAPADASSVLTENLIGEIRGLEPRTYRLGGGKTEADGSVSFLVRFVGQKESIAGELFVRQTEEKWFLDDLVLEEKKDLSGIQDSYRYDFSPYERFF